ncbi:MAG: hypothetical protein IPM29_29015 [Planctomycetes bacterium]|nr:hypothetical protein [Planctomycetota bacterium]
MPRPLPVLFAAALLLPSFSGLPAQTWEEALAKYQTWKERPSLYKRTLGRLALAETRDPRALPLLIRDYAKPEYPEGPVRYLVAQIAMDAFKGNADALLLADWRKQQDDADDAWLWFQTQRYTADRDFEALRQVITGRGDPYLRAATFEALSDRVANVDAPDGLAELCLRILTEPPRRDNERALMIECVGRVLISMKTRVRSDPWHTVALALIEQLDLEETPQRTKVVISRQLAQVFGVTNLGLESQWWRSELERTPSRPQGEGRTTTVPFFSVRTFGYRFVYVIDASDSMLRRITDNEKRELGPTTGGEGGNKPAPGDTGFVPGAADIDWSRVVTRFDAAREYLRLSLLSLNEDHEFAVLLFGDEATPLDATPKLVRATKAKVRAALAELDRIRPGPPVESRPDGVLRGKTNLHGGIAAAFRMTGTGLVRDAEYVDAKALFDGCDTVFLLSDGAPSWDDYAEKDARDPEDQAGDPEMGIRYENVPTLIFQGPYAHPPYRFLVEDVRRMNLFRRAEIHCVGIGEANHGLLEAIAAVGGGQAIRVESR